MVLRLGVAVPLLPVLLLATTSLSTRPCIAAPSLPVESVVQIMPLAKGDLPRSQVQGAADDGRSLSEAILHRPDGWTSASGFVIDSDGLLVTGDYFQSEKEPVVVRFANGAMDRARAIGRDRQQGFAIFRLEKLRPPPVRLGSSKRLQLLDRIIAVGVTPPAVGTGLVAMEGAVRSTSFLDPGDGPDTLELNLLLTPGMGGGPLLNGEGEVVGMSAFNFVPRTGASNVGWSLNLPIDSVIAVLPEIKEVGYVRRGSLGLSIQGTSSGVPGAIISEIRPGSPASLAQLQVGDLVTGFSGTRVRTSAQLVRLIQGTKPGQQTILQVIRNRKPHEVRVVAGEAPRDREN